jgi:hypothetical protein
MGTPDFTASATSTAQTENCEPTEMSICRATMTSVIPTATTSAGAADTHVSVNCR